MCAECACKCRSEIRLCPCLHVNPTCVVVCTYQYMYVFAISILVDAQNCSMCVFRGYTNTCVHMKFVYIFMRERYTGETITAR